ncbi:MAG: glycosyltransferase 87 family protein [Candidatus Rokuibacteriota bacterium]
MPRLRPVAQHLLADAEHRLLLRRPRDPAEQEGRDKIRPDRLSLDAAVVPGLLLLLSRDLLAFDPPRVLAWRLLHDPRLAASPWPVPGLPAEVDRDPIAAALGALAAGLALVYLIACLRAARPAVRGALVGLAAVVLVVAPTLAFVAMGAATGRPYGQDGGVVQLPLAIDKILDGQSPYGADYSASILGRQARVSDFWSERGGNPILRHHAYLPGTHLLMLPFHLLGRAAGWFDPRFVTLLAMAVAAALAARLASTPERRLAAAAVILLNPLVYWQQIFGANDVLIVALLLAAVALSQGARPVAAAAVLGLACATKQLAWPFAPFLLLHLSGAASWRDLAGAAGGRLLKKAAVAGAVFAAVVLPVAALDFRAFWSDIVVYNVGLPGGDNYPLGGTPGFGFANLLIYFGAVGSLRDHVSFTRFYLLLIPVGLLLAREQLRERTAATALLTGGTALLLSLYFSRVVHPNYLILAATLIPIAALLRARVGPDVVVVPLLLLAVAVEVTQGAVFRAVWSDALDVRLPAYLEGPWRMLAPRAGAELSQDPLGLLLSAVAAGLGILLLTAGVLRAGARARLAMVAVAAVAVLIVPTVVAIRVAQASGVYRAQDPWAVSLRPDPAPGVAREAWSTSFRRDPPATLERGLLRAGPFREPRVFALALVPIVAALVLALVAPAYRPLALGLMLLAPPIAVGTMFGSGALVVLASLAASGWCATRGWKIPAVVAVLVAVAASAPGWGAIGPGWLSLALFTAGTGAGWWLAMITWTAADPAAGCEGSARSGTLK